MAGATGFLAPDARRRSQSIRSLGGRYVAPLSYHSPPTDTFLGIVTMYRRERDGPAYIRLRHVDEMSRRTLAKLSKDAGSKSAAYYLRSFCFN